MNSLERLHLGSLCAAAAALTIASTAHEVIASAATTEVELEVETPSGCADRNQFVNQVHGRSERIQFVESAEKHLSIAIRGEGGNFTGVASFVEGTAESVSRTLTARSCGEVIEGLALVTVMVLDPEAVQGVPADATASELPRREEPSKSGPTLLPSSHPSPAREVSGQWTYGFDAGLRLASGPAPNAMLGFGASANVTWVSAQNHFAPRLALGFSHLSRKGYEARAGLADFALDVATLEFCPVHFLWGRFRTRPCALGSFGRLAAEGTQTFVPATEHLTWAEVAVEVRFAWAPMRYLELFAAPALGAALRRYSFSFSPYEFYREPQVTLSGIVGAGLQFE